MGIYGGFALEKPTKRNPFPPLPLTRQHPQQGPALPTAPAGTAAPGVAARSQEAVPASGAQFGSTPRHLAAPSGSNRHRRDLQSALTSNKRSKTQAPPPMDPAEAAASEDSLLWLSQRLPTADPPIPMQSVPFDPAHTPVNAAVARAAPETTDWGLPQDDEPPQLAQDLAEWFDPDFTWQQDAFTPPHDPTGNEVDTSLEADLFMQEIARAEGLDEDAQLAELLADDPHEPQTQKPVAEGFAVAQPETAVNDEDWDKVLELMRGAGMPNSLALQVKNSGVSPKALGEFLEKKGPIELNFKSKILPAVFKMENRDDMFKAMGQLNAQLALEPGKPGSFDRDTRNALLGTLVPSKKTRSPSDVLGTFSLNVITLEEKKYFSVHEAIKLTKTKNGWVSLNTAVTGWESFKSFELSKEKILEIAKHNCGNQLLQGLLKVLPQLYEKLEVLSQYHPLSDRTSDNAQKEELKKQKEEILNDLLGTDLRKANNRVTILNKYFFNYNNHPIGNYNWHLVKDFFNTIPRSFGVLDNASEIYEKALASVLENNSPIDLNSIASQLPTPSRRDNHDELHIAAAQLNAKLALGPGTPPDRFDQTTHTAISDFLNTRQRKTSIPTLGTFSLNLRELGQNEDSLRLGEALDIANSKHGFSALNTAVTGWDSLRGFALSKEWILKIAKNEYGYQLLQGLLKVLPQLYEKLELLSQDQMSSGDTFDNVAQKEALKKRKEEILKDIFMKDIRITNHCVNILNTHLDDKNRNPITKESWPSVKEFLSAIKYPVNSITLKDHLQKLNEILKNPTSPS
jgi:hypothetical protein